MKAITNRDTVKRRMVLENKYRAPRDSTVVQGEVENMGGAYLDGFLLD